MLKLIFEGRIIDKTKKFSEKFLKFFYGLWIKGCFMFEICGAKNGSGFIGLLILDVIMYWAGGGGISGLGCCIWLLKFPPFFCQICKDLLIGGGFVNLKRI